VKREGLAARRVVRVVRLILPMMVGACATPERWTKAGADDANTAKDTEQCQALGRDEALRRYPYMAGSGPSDADQHGPLAAAGREQPCKRTGERFQRVHARKRLREDSGLVAALTWLAAAASAIPASLLSPWRPTGWAKLSPVPRRWAGLPFRGSRIVA
jgi:hypothetical protein